MMKSKANLTKDILTADEVAKYLQIKKRTLYNKIRNGEIPARRLGKKWLFEKENLLKWFSQKESIPEEKSEFETISISQTLEPLKMALNAILQGAFDAGIERIYKGRRNNEALEKRIEELIVKAKGEVLLCGISLREYFRGDRRFNDIIWEKLENNIDFKVKVLMLDPFSDAGKARVVAEEGTRFAQEPEFKESVLYVDVRNSTNTILRLQEEKRNSKKNNFDIEARFYGCAPMSYFIITANAMIIEPYHMGRENPQSAKRGCIGELVPLLEMVPSSPYYHIMRDHFHHIFYKKNPYISVKDIKEIKTLMG